MSTAQSTDLKAVWASTYKGTVAIAIATFIAAAGCFLSAWLRMESFGVDTLIEDFDIVGCYIFAMIGIACAFFVTNKKCVIPRFANTKQEKKYFTTVRMLESKAFECFVAFDVMFALAVLRHDAAFDDRTIFWLSAGVIMLAFTSLMCLMAMQVKTKHLNN